MCVLALSPPSFLFFPQISLRPASPLPAEGFPFARECVRPWIFGRLSDRVSKRRAPLKRKRARTRKSPVTRLHQRLVGDCNWWFSYVDFLLLLSLKNKCQVEPRSDHQKRILRIGTRKLLHAVCESLLARFRILFWRF